jgi:hypothetical protein
VRADSRGPPTGNEMMRSIGFNFIATALGLLLTLVAVANSFVTVATSRASGYRGVLLTALVCEVLALGCFAVPFARGPMRWRVTAAVLASPALFVMDDFVRRAPGVFGWG